MGSDTNPNDRMIRLYFGKPGDPRPTKQEVATFITDQMGLVQGDGKPRWSEGIGELLELGMDAEADRLDAVNPDDHKRIQELEEKVENYRIRVQQLEQELEKRRLSDGILDAADRVHRVEARILEVLCRDDHHGARSMNYVDLYTVTEQTGLEYNTVVEHAESLSRDEFGGHVQLDDYGEKAKATSPDAFTDYCAATDLDPDQIRLRNDPV